MEVVITRDEDELGELVADIFSRLLGRQPGAVLGLATGSSPLPVYRSLIRRCRSGLVSFAQASCFLLDEYVGLPPSHPRSYRAFVVDNLTGRVDLPAARLHGPDGTRADLAAACVAYEQAIDGSGGIDLQLLGIGTDGHIGFNEPSSSLGSTTRLKTLTHRTRSDNARFFDGPDDVPRHVITQGIATILRSRHAVLIAAGENKAEALAACVEGPITAMCPASALQLHPHVTIVVDEAAADRLTLTDYYRETLAAKPAWQEH